ncbi:hypothetical protein PR003_g14689 [Phytophthora rubi]|uniref:Uncharacterized protein n=1 Tax=Phytophthora rubi TaxID=129364 RepID=A0A6A4ETY6_9STRA|nr:hypothetical protein PR003_g14689 [Phytophthora rubi]
MTPWGLEASRVILRFATSSASQAPNYFYQWRAVTDQQDVATWLSAASGRDRQRHGLDIDATCLSIAQQSEGDEEVAVATKRSRLATPDALARSLARLQETTLVLLPRLLRPRLVFRPSSLTSCSWVTGVDAATFFSRLR